MFLFFIFHTIVHSEFQKDRSYTVSVMSKYSNVQPVDNFLYFLSDFSYNNSNHFLTTILQHHDSSQSINDAEFLFSTISTLNIISPSSLSLLRNYIDLNYFLPRCEMFRSFAHDITAESINLINNDSGYFLASKNPIEQADVIQTNLTEVFTYDLQLNEYNNQRETIFIYADVTKSKSSEFIAKIITQENSYYTNYNLILRPISFTQAPAKLRGFGVEMRPYQYLMEYEVDDSIDKSSNSNQLNANKEDNTTKGIDFEISSDSINYSDISFFGSRFVNFLNSAKMDQEEDEGRKVKEMPELLRDMSNNLPLYIRRISEEETSVESTKEFDKFSFLIDRSKEQQSQNNNEDNGQIYPLSTINGRYISINNFDPFTFLDNIHEEQRFLDILREQFNLTQNNLSFREAFLPNDEFLLDYRTKYAIWDKDFENDPEYRDYSTNVKDIFHLRKNILSFAVYMDPSSPIHITELYTIYLLSQPEKLHNDRSRPKLPIRIGIIPHFNLGSRISRRISFAFAHIALHNPSDAIMFLLNSLAIWRHRTKNSKEGSPIREEHYISAYKRIKGSYKVDWSDLHKLYSKSSKEYNFIKEANKYFKSCGAQLGTIRINGKKVSLDNSFQDVLTQVKDMLISLSKICLRDGINDLKDVDIVDILKKEYLVVDSIDSQLMQAPVVGTGLYKMENKKQEQFIDAFNKIEWRYKDNNEPRSYFILFTPEQEKPKEAKNNDNDNEEDENEGENEGENVTQKVDGDRELFAEFAKNRNHRRSSFFAINPPSIRDFIGIGENETALLVNGRLYRSFRLESISQLKLIDMWTNHFVLSYLDQFTNKNNRKKPSPKKEKVLEDIGFANENYNQEEQEQENVNQIDQENENENDDNDDEIEEIKPVHLSFEALAYLSAVAVDWRSFSVKRVNLGGIIDNVKGIKESPLYYTNKNSSQKSDKIEWILIVDPISRSFQKVIDFVHHLAIVRNYVDLQLIVVPPREISAEAAMNNLNSFYRFSINSDDVTFSMLNDTTSYSTLVDTPQSWLLETLKTSENVDIDNIHLTRPNSDIEATFLLSSMIVEGKCFIDGAPNPKYADIGLFTKKSQRNNFHSEKVDETTVMPMNSYFQFKANPGVYRVAFSTNTSSNLYTFDTDQNRNQKFPLFDNIYISTFSNNELVLHAKTRAKNAESFRHSLNERINRLKVESSLSNKTKSHINIFTISSGKLYEKLCKIMFLSVREHTNSAITFYLIKSFLSPSFKASLPEMSQRYHFNYYLVDYKWPSWLLRQREKQRLIWANKILFLDVLFPNSVDKIIYVDADQIVRTDLQELMNMNITENGAPYAFVPFCDSRAELEPYRFWKTGYWKEVLTKDIKDKVPTQNIINEELSYKYHISALFLIDMLKFKEIGAGDLLRANYQQLASNPNNLANLDQDLPNLIQKHVPIYSLSQDWLWCETWCADEEMESAKTIDLCNNPLTKINKVEIAKKRVEEWPRLEEKAMKTEDNFSSNDYEHLVFHN